MARTKWKDLSDRQRALVMAGAAVQVTLQVLALWDLRRRPAEQVRGRKALWAMATCVNTIGPITYFAFGRRRREG